MRFIYKQIIYYLLLVITLSCDHAIAHNDLRIPEQKFNQLLHDQLPPHILKSKEMIAVNYGSMPPYIIYTEDNQLQGLNIDFMQAVSEILGVKIIHEQVAGLSAGLLGVQNGRYDLGIGLVSDTAERQKNADFIAYARSFAAFGVLKGNPGAIESFFNSCGKIIAVQSGTTLEQTLLEQSKQCVKEGKSAIDIKIFKDQAAAILAVKSGRADACFMPAPILGYYMLFDKGLEFLDTQRNTPHRTTAIMVAKNSALGPILLAAYRELFANGTYALIMKKWGLEESMIMAPALN